MSNSRTFVTTRAGLLLATMATTLLAGLPALAQEEEITEIIVTVRQRAESIQDVPGAVTAFSAADIQATGIQRAEDFIYQTPGVSLVANTAEVGDTQVNIRGINGTRDAETNYALIIDGILMTNPAALNREYINLQQIEILKGPQGAIYGRNAAAGAIIITTEKPGYEWGGQVKASAAEDSTEVFSGVFSGPVGDTLGVSVGGSFRDTDGYYNNAYFSSPRFLGPPGSAPDAANVDQFKSWDMTTRALWEPSDSLTVDAKLRFGQVEASSIAFNSTFQIPSLVGFLESVFLFPPELAAGADENVNDHSFQFDNNIKPFNNQDSLETSVKVDYDLGWADLTGWGLYSDIENELGADGTSGAFRFFFPDQQCIDTTNQLGFYPVTPPQLIVPQDAFGPGSGGPGGSLFGAYTPTACDGTQFQERNQTDYSFEVRLASKGDQRLRWLGGLYYLNIDREVGVNTGLDQGFGVISSLYTTDVRNPTQQLARDKFTTDVYAVFGQLAYDLTDTIEASLALRYDLEDREVENDVPAPQDGALTPFINTCNPTAAITTPQPINAGYCPPTPGDPFLTDIPDQSEDYDELQPKVSLTWDASDSITAYATAGVGFKSGGFNNAGSAATVDRGINQPLLGPGGPFAGQYAPVLIEDSYREETSWAYEGGLKTQWLDDRLRAEVAVYYVDVDDMQFFEFFVGGFGLLRVVSNIDEVEIWGQELSLNFAATDWLTLYAGANFNDTEIKKNVVRPDSVGNESPYTPEYTWSTGAQVQFPLSGDYDFVGSLDIAGVGETWFHVIQNNDRPTIFSLQFPLEAANYDIAKRDPYSLVNLRAGVSSDRWSLVGFISNAFDESFLNEVIPAPEFGGSFISPGTERRVGVEATLRF
jgi:iron complex outermembrane receptor protein